MVPLWALRKCICLLLLCKELVRPGCGVVPAGAAGGGVAHPAAGELVHRGKLLNVRDATASQISDNQEIQHIKQILGLQHGRQYEDAKALRYGHLMIMTDQV